MSLDWRIDKIANRETVCWVGDGDRQHMNPVTESLIWRTMSLDLGEITKKNIPEWMFRSRYYSRLFGKPLNRAVERCNCCDSAIVDGEQCCSDLLGGTHNKIEHFDYRMDDLKAHVGLSTNVRSVTRASFLRKMTDALVGDVERVVRIDMERDEKPTD